LKVKKPILLLPAVGIIFSGLMLIISPVAAIFIFKSISTVIGIMLMLTFTVIAAWQMSLFRAIACTQIGEWPGIVKTLAVAVVLQLIAILLTEDLLLILNLVALGLEGMALALVYFYRSAFMPSEEEVASSLKRFASVTVKTTAQCPKCSAVVEVGWALCPDCGTRLSRFCARCGTEVREGEHTCCKCGAELEVPAALIAMVDTLRRTAEMENVPLETRSARYARLGEGLLKIGQLEEAMGAYRKAVHYTQFDRKRTNFMVKMAVVMANKGLMQEAEQLLDAAQQLDPEDVAGARKVREELYQERPCPA
jgi:tetratricopeptide (TPR) repeat protein